MRISFLRILHKYNTLCTGREIINHDYWPCNYIEHLVSRVSIWDNRRGNYVDFSYQHTPHSSLNKARWINSSDGFSKIIYHWIFLLLAKKKPQITAAHFLLSFPVWTAKGGVLSRDALRVITENVISLVKETIVMKICVAHIGATRPNASKSVAICAPHHLQALASSITMMAGSGERSSPLIATGINSDVRTDILASLWWRHIKLDRYPVKAGARVAFYGVTCARHGTTRGRITRSRRNRGDKQRDFRSCFSCWSF